MLQRMPHDWVSSPGRHPHPQLLIEDDDPALAVSDFSRFEEAGFRVALCSGAGSRPEDCPLHRQADCALLASADVVLHRLGPEAGAVAAGTGTGPGVVVVQHRDSIDLRSGPTDRAGHVVLEPSATVEAQIRALRRVLHASVANRDAVRPAPA